MDKIKGTVKFNYDPVGDVLYTYINKPRPAKCSEIEDGILLRIDPHTKKIVGFTIIDYNKRMISGKIKNIPYFEDFQFPNVSEK